MIRFDGFMANRRREMFLEMLRGPRGEGCNTFVAFIKKKSQKVDKKINTILGENTTFRQNAWKFEFPPYIGQNATWFQILRRLCIFVPVFIFARKNVKKKKSLKTPQRKKNSKGKPALDQKGF